MVGNVIAYYQSNLTFNPNLSSFLLNGYSGFPNNRFVLPSAQHHFPVAGKQGLIVY
jgi:hypothetical protein